MNTPKFDNAHKTSADMLRKYQDMILENQEEIDEDDEQVEEGKLPAGQRRRS
jgi:DNA gyrase inhibitor GyrI